MIKYTLADIQSMNSAYRRNFINTLAGFKSANLIGTISESGINNLAIFNSVIHLGANPPLMGFILRPLTVPRQTYTNLKTNKFFTFNHVNSDIIEQAHQTSAKYDEHISEFDTTGLHVEKSNIHPAPYVQESHIKIGLKYKEEHLIEANQTLLIVGEIVEIIIPQEVVSKDGFINLDNVKTVAISGLDGYYNTEKINRFEYARPNQDTNVMKD